MDIPTKAQVACADGPVGQVRLVIVNPLTKAVTHLVVQEDTPARTERLVPLSLVRAVEGTTVRLSCDTAEFKRLQPFIEMHFSDAELPFFEGGDAMSWPYLLLDEGFVTERHLPPGELAIHRGAKVMATDGPVGRVDEFIVKPENGHISHLVVLEPGLLEKREVAVPIDAIARIEEDQVYLNLDRAAVHALPHVPYRRFHRPRS